MSISAAPQLTLAPEPSKRPSIIVRQIIVPQLMTMEALATWLDMDVRALRMIVSRSRNGKGGVNPIPFIQPQGKGKWIRFDYDEIREWLKGGRIVK
jgi:hypothetical protein